MRRMFGMLAGAALAVVLSLPDEAEAGARVTYCLSKRVREIIANNCSFPVIASWIDAKGEQYAMSIAPNERYDTSKLSDDVDEFQGCEADSLYDWSAGRCARPR